MTPAITGPPAGGGVAPRGCENRTRASPAPRRPRFPARRSRPSPKRPSRPPRGRALNDENAPETARWYLPEAMLRHEGGAEPENVRILRARRLDGTPVHDGDRLLVDIAHETPAIGEMAVLWDGNGLVVKRVEAHIARTVLWALSGVWGLGSSTRRHGLIADLHSAVDGCIRGRRGGDTSGVAGPRGGARSLRPVPRPEDYPAWLTWFAFPVTDVFMPWWSGRIDAMLRHRRTWSGPTACRS